jgi:hypothetical protein
MLTSIKENAMPRYQFLNIETFHLIIADAKEVPRELLSVSHPAGLKFRQVPKADLSSSGAGSCYDAEERIAVGRAADLP